MNIPNVIPGKIKKSLKDFYMKERSAEMKFWPAAKVSGAKPEHAGFHV
ncbi:MAG: hypothetical protein GY795_19805 [Desulfobacterales bacterium]|nr:hypothetical protein [Desulfobacterales bacterium]